LSKLGKDITQEKAIERKKEERRQIKDKKTKTKIRKKRKY
jgi:hypothetical protein